MYNNKLKSKTISRAPPYKWLILLATTTHLWGLRTVTMVSSLLNRVVAARVSAIVPKR